MKTYFFLRDNNAKVSTIQLNINHKSNRKKFSTGFEIETKAWDSKKKLPRSSGNWKKYFQMHLELKSIDDAINDKYQELVNDNDFSWKEFIDYEVKDILGREVDIKVNTLSIIEFFNHYTLKKVKDNKNKGSSKNLQNQNKRIITFIDACYPGLRWKGFDYKVLEHFENWMRTTRQVAKKRNQRGYDPSTIKVTLGYFKTLLNEAYKEDLITDRQKKKWDDHNIKVKKPSVVSLTEKELTLFENVKFDSTKKGFTARRIRKLEKIKDIFLLCCYTAFRVSDIQTFLPEHVSSDKMIIHKITEKTQKDVFIPISPKARIILEKYNYDIPRNYSLIQINRALPVIAKEAGITEVFEHSKKGLIPKYNLISSHVGRKTFATLAVKKGDSWSNIMKITGHKSENSFIRYIGEDAELEIKVTQKMKIFQ